MRKFKSPEGYTDTHPSETSLIYTTTKVMENGVAKDVLSAVPLEMVDNREAFSADDFRLDNLINSGSLDLLKNTTNMELSNLEALDHTESIVKSLKNTPTNE